MLDPHDLDLTPSQQKSLSKMPEVYIRAGLARNPSALPAVQRTLTTDNDPLVRAGLAKNTAVLPELQHVLAADPSDHVRGRLAGNRALLPELQRLFAASSNLSVKGRLATNPSLLPDLQPALSFEPAFHGPLMENPAFAPAPTMAVSFLERTAAGRDLIDLALAELDRETCFSFRSSWTGDLVALVAVCESLGPDA